MKFLPVLAGAALAAMSFAPQAQAAGGLTCGQLAEADRELSDVLNTLEAQGVVQENSGFDNRLRIAADTAVSFAVAEGDQALINLANAMRDGWEFKNADQYIANGDTMIDIYRSLYNRDC